MKMKKSVLLTAAVVFSMAALAGCGEKYGYDDAEYYTLNKCDASSEELVEVGVGGPWSYDDEFSTDEVDMYLDHEDGGFIYISNEAMEPLYTYSCAYVNGEHVNAHEAGQFEDMGYENYKCSYKKIGSALEGSDLILVEESFTYADTKEECTYLIIKYSDDGYIEFLTVDFYNMDTDDWSDEDFEELARNLFGK